MRLFLALLLLAFAGSVSANSDYYTNPQHPGRHYDCNKPGVVVAYENSDVIILCGAITERVERHFFKDRMTYWAVVDPSKILVKSPEGVKLSPEEAATVALRQLQEPFYDSSEKRMVRFMGAGLALDLVTSVAGVSSGVCSEAGPIAGHVPYLSLVLAGYTFVHTRHGAMKSPRYFTWSKDKAAWAVGATHGIAGVHNLLTCS